MQKTKRSKNCPPTLRPAPQAPDSSHHRRSRGINASEQRTTTWHPTRVGHISRDIPLPPSVRQHLLDNWMLSRWCRIAPICLPCGGAASKISPSLPWSDPGSVILMSSTHGFFAWDFCVCVTEGPPGQPRSGQVQSDSGIVPFLCVGLR